MACTFFLLADLRQKAQKIEPQIARRRFQIAAMAPIAIFLLINLPNIPILYMNRSVDGSFFLTSVFIIVKVNPLNCIPYL